jgi:hypothetical protein
MALPTLMLFLFPATSSTSVPNLYPAVENACLARCGGPEPPAHAPSDILGPCAQFSKHATVFGFCEAGAAKGARSGCVQGCRGGGAHEGGAFCFNSDATSSPWLAEARAGACAALQQAAPRPLAWDACQHGFNAGVQSGCAASHHWAVGEAERARAAESAADAARNAALAEELAASEAALERLLAEKGERARAAAAAAAAAEQRAAAEREAAAAAARDLKRGKVRGK